MSKSRPTRHTRQGQGQGQKRQLSLEEPRPVLLHEPLILERSDPVEDFKLHLMYETKKRMDRKEESVENTIKQALK